LHGQKLEHHLVKIGALDENTLACFLARQDQLPFVYLSDMDTEPDCFEQVPLKTTLGLKVMPMFINANEMAARKRFKHLFRKKIKNKTPAPNLKSQNGSTSSPS